MTASSMASAAKAPIQHDSAKRQSMIAIIGAKIVAVLAVGGAIFYGVAYVGQRAESDVIRGVVESAVAPGTRRRSSSLEFLQRRAAEKEACASGNLSGDCSHLVEREAVPAANAGTAGASSRSAETHDPPHTGTVKTSAKVGRQGKPQRSRRLAATSLPRPSRVAARSRAHQAHAGRPGRTGRWVARRHRPGVDERYYPRVAYTPWWVPGHSWHERSN
jgi:hypothetical protein